MEHLTGTFHSLLFSFRTVFTEPSFQIFLTLVTGWVVSVRHRFVTELIYSGDHVGVGHWSRFHRFFSHHSWSLDDLCLVLARLLIAAFAASMVKGSVGEGKSHTSDVHVSGESDSFIVP